MTRQFQLTTYLTFPLDVLPAPGGLAEIKAPGTNVEFDDELVERNRFIRGRIRAGDLVETTEAMAPQAVSAVSRTLAAAVPATAAGKE
jgi:hypothetical protein